MMPIFGALVVGTILFAIAVYKGDILGMLVSAAIFSVPATFLVVGRRRGWYDLEWWKKR